MTIISFVGFICQFGQFEGFKKNRFKELTKCLCFPIHVFGLLHVFKGYNKTQPTL